MNISAQSSTNDLWEEVSKPNVILKAFQPEISYPNTSVYFKLNYNDFAKNLENAPQRSAFNPQNSETIISFPNEDGSLSHYKIVEASTMTPDFQALFPNIRSYAGTDINDPTKIIRFSVSNEKGVSSMLLSDENTVFIEPYSEDLSTYVVYRRSPTDERSNFVCETEFVEQDLSNFDIEAYRNANDGQLRTFRLALACTGEYAQFHGGTVANVVAAMNTTMTRVNAVFERDVALTMVMVNNTSIIYLNGGTDPYNNNNGGAMLGQNQTVCDTNIGTGNYDIGHVFSTGGGGVAYLNSPCTGFKAGGVTGQAAPVGDTFDIDYVAHEMGHQYGGNHTQNNNCQRSAVSVEPGSASTIMGYAGICAPNVQTNSDDYFHGQNIIEMWANISSGNSQCAAQNATGNNAPVANAGSNHIIPISTPFILRGSATDADAGNGLTYCWEQIDATPAVMPPVATSTAGPAFRSLLPQVSPNRFMPDFATVLTGATASTWEVVPSVNRTMNFSLTVRDNVAGGASSDSDNMTATTTTAAGPFIVTSQGAPTNWNVGGSELITWNVAGTTGNGVNAANVNILLTEDAGATFTTLLANTPNDGSELITVPNILTSTARIIVEGAGNLFYNVNAADITIVSSDFALNFSNTVEDICAPNDAVYNFTYNTFSGFSGTTNFSATGNPVGSTVSFSPTSATANGTAVTMTVSGLTNAMAGSYTITASGTSGAITRSSNVTLNVFTNVFNGVTLLSPTNGAIGIVAPYNLTWSSDSNASSYDVEIATDYAFTNIVESQTVAVTSYNATLIAADTQYYWRVRPTNNCGVGNWSSIFNFTTISISCNTENSTDTPLNIPDFDGFGIPSVINVTTPVQITDVNVTVNVTHSWDSDIVLLLSSPQGTNVFLTFQNGADGDDYINTVFDDSAATSIVAGTPPFTGSFQPEEPLSNFNNELSTGNWTLRAYDLGFLDVGTLDDWSLEICGNNSCLTTTTWNGTNWSNGNPSIHKNAIIDGDYTTSTLTPSFEACSLTINANSTLTVTADNYIKIQNDLTISNNAVLDVEHEGSIVMVDDLGTVTNNGTTTIRKTTPSYVEYDFTYWSSPVLNETIGNVFSANPSNQIFYFDTTNFNDNDDDSFDDEQDDWYVASGTMSPGIGIAAMGEGAFNTALGNTPYPLYTQSVVFNGEVNNGVYSINIEQDNSSTDTFTNQNLLGNPYPSAINPEIFIQENANALEGTLYFWTHRTFITDALPGPDTYNFSNDDYNSYNLSGMVASGAGQATPTNYRIASGQGFFANVSDPNINVVFNNSMRVTSGNDTFYRNNTPIVKDRLWLNLTTEGNIFRQTLIAFFEHTTEGYDKLYDSKQIENGNNYSFFSLIEEEKYTIQARESFNDLQEIALGYESTQPGEMTISIGNMEGVITHSQTNIYLEDTELNIIHNLKNSDYSFTTDTGIFTKRFILRFNVETLDNPNDTLISDELLIYETSDMISIKTKKNELMSSIKAYDILGRLIIDSNNSTTLLELNPNRFKSGTVLIFKVILENGNSMTKKIIVH